MYGIHHHMYSDALQKIGLAKNEARIYETLVREGELGVSHISLKSEVHRRNVYDSLNRLIEKGLVFEIVAGKENKYQAVEPRRLSEMIDEKQEVLSEIMPDLESWYFNNPETYKVYTYRGKEGWKNYMRDIIRTGEDFYSIAAQGAWMDERVRSFFPGFLKQLQEKKIQMRHLFDDEVRKNNHPILNHVGKKYMFIPKKYATNSGIDVFGDRVNIMHEQHLGSLADDLVFTVIVNKNLADSFRTWFQMMWDFLPKK